MSQVSPLYSYIDLKKLVEASMYNETNSMERLEAKRDTYDQEQDDWTLVKSGLSSFESSLESLQSPSNFYSRLATSGDDDIVTAV